MRTLREDGIRKVLVGMTTPDEVITSTQGDK
jgi:general secretion pathway protein E/type IV pilus assembly protein PilB